MSKRGFASSHQLAVEAGTKGGNALKTKFGINHFRQIGKKGGNRVSSLYGRQHFCDIGRQGGLQRGVSLRQKLEETDH